jgi:hypothetical protein
MLTFLIITGLVVTVGLFGWMTFEAIKNNM